MILEVSDISDNSKLATQKVEKFLLNVLEHFLNSFENQIYSINLLNSILKISVLNGSKDYLIKGLTNKI